jgi:hypothetical protein
MVTFLINKYYLTIFGGGDKIETGLILFSLEDLLFSPQHHSCQEWTPFPKERADDYTEKDRVSV